MKTNERIFVLFGYVFVCVSVYLDRPFVRLVTLYTFLHTVMWSTEYTPHRQIWYTQVALLLRRYSQCIVVLSIRPTV